MPLILEPCGPTLRKSSRCSEIVLGPTHSRVARRRIHSPKRTKTLVWRNGSPEGIEATAVGSPSLAASGALAFLGAGCGVQDS